MLAQLKPPSYSASSSDLASSTTDADNYSSLPTKAAKQKSLLSLSSDIKLATDSPTDSGTETATGTETSAAYLSADSATNSAPSPSL